MRRSQRMFMLCRGANETGSLPCMKPLLSLALCGLAAFGCTTQDENVDEQDVQLPQIGVNVVTGTLLIGGCTPPPGLIEVTAAETSFVADTANTQPQAAPPVRRAQLIPTNDPHQFTIRFVGLDPTGLYRLAVDLKPQAPCPKVVWRGPEGGWLAGSNQQLRIEGAALRTQTEILGVRPGQNITGWGAAEPIDLADPQGAIRTIRWRTDVPGTQYGLVQISADPFTAAMGQQAQPRILASWYVARPSQGWAQLPALDFGRIANLACDPQANPNGCPVCDPQDPQNQGTCSRTARGSLQKDFQHGAPLYVRVVPTDWRGNALDDLRSNGIPSLAKLVPVHRQIPDLAPPPPVDPLELHIAYQPAENQHDLAKGGTCFRITEDHPIGPDVCNVFNPFTYNQLECNLSRLWPADPTIPAGRRYCVIHHSGGFLSSAWDAVDGFFDALGAMYNDIANLYEKIKTAVIDGVATVLTDLGIVHCEETCKAALRVGLNIGLAALGIPPTLPNWDELKAEGIDYLEKEAAEESGVPEEAIEAMEKIAGKAIENMKPTPAGMPSWVIADDGFRAPMLHMTVSKNPAFHDPMLPNAFAFDTFDSYSAAEVILPPGALRKGDTLQVPVRLAPDMSGLTRFQICGVGVCSDLQPLTDEHLEDDWYRTKYTSQPCFRFGAVGKAYGLMAGGPWLLGTFGEMMRWTVPTTTWTVSDARNLVTCY